MKIGIVGLGIVGLACHFGFQKLGHTVYGHDIKFETKLTDLLQCNVIYVCVPTPKNKDGSCNVSIVEKVVKDLNKLNYRGVIAIHSTVIPGTTARLQQEINKNLDICFVPEFLRERCAISDFVENQKLLVVGTTKPQVYKLIKECHGTYFEHSKLLTPTEAEIIKYYSNIFNALRVIFANEMYELCQAYEADYTAIKNTFIKLKTTPDIYLDVNDNFRGYAGTCLPKDIIAIVQEVKRLNLDLKLFETIHEENKKFKKTVFPGTRLLDE